MRREKASLPVDVRHSKTSLLKFPNILSLRKGGRLYTGYLKSLLHRDTQRFFSVKYLFKGANIA